MLENFMAPPQLRTVRSYSRFSEEREFFQDKIREIEELIKDMPKTYDTQDQKDPLVTLHYFYGSCDWWIIEKDKEPEQLQAFGYACLNGDTQNAELGYISIEELKSINAELDLYFRPRPLSEVKNKIAA